MKRYLLDALVVIATAGMLWLVRDYVLLRSTTQQLVGWVNQQAQQAQARPEAPKAETKKP